MGRYKLYKILKRVPIIRMWAFRISLWIMPPSHEEWGNLIEAMKDIEEGE